MTDADVASCWLHVSEVERLQLVTGVVPERVRDLAKYLAYEAYQARWNANAAKPETTTKKTIRRRARTASAGAASSRTAGTHGVKSTGSA